MLPNLTTVCLPLLLPLKPINLSSSSTKSVHHLLSNATEGYPPFLLPNILLPRVQNRSTTSPNVTKVYSLSLSSLIPIRSQHINTQSSYWLLPLIISLSHITRLHSPSLLSSTDLLTGRRWVKAGKGDYSKSRQHSKEHERQENKNHKQLFEVK